MIKINYILFLILISFTFQFDHCFQTAKICKKNIETSSTPSGSIANCIDYEEGDDQICKECAMGYAVSYERNKCISFSYCSSLLQGNTKCKECYPGFYFNGKECTKIPIDNCLSLNDDGDKCTECSFFSKLNGDGSKCVLFEQSVEGCSYYDNDGNCGNCDNDLYSPNGSGSSITCTFKGCPGDSEVEYCETCHIGYYTDTSDGNCKPYKTANSNNSKTNKIGYAFLILMLSLLI